MLLGILHAMGEAVELTLVPELNPTFLTTPIVVVVAFFDTEPRHYAHQLVLIEFRGTIYFLRPSGDLLST